MKNPCLRAGIFLILVEHKAAAGAFEGRNRLCGLHPRHMLYKKDRLAVFFVSINYLSL